MKTKKRKPATLLPLAATLILGACGGDESQSINNTAAPLGNPVAGATVAERINASTRSILPKQPGKNWVFDAYVSADSPSVAWSRFWTKAVDFSGVAWDHRKTLTMVSPRHAMMAAHYTRPPGTPVILHDRRGREVERAILGVEKLYSDIAVVLLHEDVPPTVKIYPVLTPSDRYAEELPGAYALVTDRERKVHVHEVGRTFANHVAFRKSTTLDEGFYESIISGDSGNPSFVLVRGQPVLIETHHTGGPGAGPFFGTEKNITAINEAMQRLSEAHNAPVHQLRTVTP